MPLHVLFTMDCGSEALLAKRTLVGLHAHVRGRVPGEAAVGCEGSVADAAAERLFSCDSRDGVRTRSLPENRTRSKQRCAQQAARPRSVYSLRSPSFRD